MEDARTLELVRVKLDQRIGTELGGYRIVEQLGRGGTSVVYRAEHVRLGRGAALKLLSPGLGEADFSDRFLRESRLAASLDHPNIVPVYDAGEDDDLLWIAMACVEGTDLKTLIAEEGRLPVRRALSITGQIASALDAAHARGLVHRDVKPANILIGPDDRAYLSDFGAVKELASAGTTRTGNGVIAKALAKAPVDRYATPGDLVVAARAAVAERKVDARRLLVSLSLLVLAGLVGAAVALGVRAAWSGGGGEPATTASVTPQPPAFDLKKLLELKDGQALYDISYILINSHRYKDALPFAQKAYRRTHTNPTHAFATFNLGYVLLRRGNCRDGLRLMRASLPNQPAVWQRAVRSRISHAEKRCARS